MHMRLSSQLLATKQPHAEVFQSQTGAVCCHTAYHTRSSYLANKAHRCHRHQQQHLDHSCTPNLRQHLVPSALSSASIDPSILQEGQQQQRQQQEEMDTPRQHNRSIFSIDERDEDNRTYTGQSSSSGSSNSSSRSSSSSSDTGTPPAAVSLLVIEIFAGSYSAGRLATRLNADTHHGRTAVSAYAAVELNPVAFGKAPNHRILGLKDPSRFLSIQGSITDPAVQGKVMLFAQQMLQQSADGSGEPIDGVMLFGGPPCTNYTALQNLNMQKVIKYAPERFQRKLFASDRIVEAFLTLYGSIRALAAVPGAVQLCSQQPVPTAIVMENPESHDTMNVPYTEDEISASRGTLTEDSIKMSFPLALKRRGVLQAHLATNGGYLHYSRHCWCSYAPLSHPKKPTAIFSDVWELSDAPCICQKCRPKGLRGSFRHPTNVEGLEGGDGGERATWPDAFVTRTVRLFSSRIVRSLHSNH